MPQDPGEEDWDNLVFISQLLYETSLLVAIKNTSKKRRKIDFFQILPGLFCIFFFLQWSVVNLSSTIEKFKILVIVLLQQIIRDQTCYYYPLCLWWNLHLLFSRFAKNRDLLGRNAGFSLQQWCFLLCHHPLYAELVWMWEKSME